MKQNENLKFLKWKYANDLQNRNSKLQISILQIINIYPFHKWQFHKKLTPFQSPELEVRKKNYKTFWNCFLSILIVIIFLFLWDNATLSYVEFKVWDTLCWRATSCGFWWTITFTNIIQWNNFCCITWKQYVLS